MRFWLKKESCFEDVFYLQVFVRSFCLVAKAYENVTVKRVENMNSILPRGWLKPVRLCLKSDIDHSVQRQKAQKTSGENVVVSIVFWTILKPWSFQVWMWNNRWHMCLKKAPQENAGKSLSDFFQELLILDRVLDTVSRKNGFLKIWHSAKTVVVRNGFVPFASNSISREHASA